MEFKFSGKTYRYCEKTHQVFTASSKLVKNQAQMLKVVAHFQESMEVKGFSFRMNYQEFDSYISVLGAPGKNELFHKIYEHYTYGGSLLSEKGISQADYFKIMAKLKRYEQYLYKILKS